MRRLFLAAAASLLCLSAATPPKEQGRYVTYMLLHEVGSETYAVDGSGVMTVASSLSDRGTVRASTSTLKLGPGYAPLMLETRRPDAPAGEVWRIAVEGGLVTAQEADARRSFAPPPLAYPTLPSTPAAVQMMLMRYWLAHGAPQRLPVLRASERATPLEISRVGEDVVRLADGQVRLTRYTVANLLFGREIVWMDPRGRLAALMTFAGGLPVEQVLEPYRPVFDQLVRSGVAQEMADLDALGRQMRPEAEGSFAIVGARLIDGTGAPPVEDAVVVVRDGRIVAAGARGKVVPPAGTRVIHAEGQSLLPGLWEMHSHYSGVEFGPALMAAGVTSARDCGGEFGFLTAVRDRIAGQGALGPRLLLAGLIDSGGPKGFGKVDAETPAEAATAVDRYADAGFVQIKVYDQLSPEVLKAVAVEAHRRGLTVTGHVPAAIDAFQGVEDGMDQINHLQFVTRAMQPRDVSKTGASRAGGAEVDLTSERAKSLLALLKAHQIVIDPTDAWGEMASHPKAIPAISFEPGLEGAPYVLAAKFEALGRPGDVDRFHKRMEANGRAIAALYHAGVPIVAGSDTNLIGYGLDRELELYVQAGLPPMAAIQTATLNAARAMRLERESGTVEAGKRADLMLVEGNPLTDISDLRRVTKVVRAGQLYDSRALARSVGFARSVAPVSMAVE